MRVKEHGNASVKFSYKLAVDLHCSCAQICSTVGYFASTIARNYERGIPGLLSHTQRTANFENFTAFSWCNELFFYFLLHVFFSASYEMAFGNLPMPLLCIEFL